MKFILGSLLAWQTFVAAEIKNYRANVCVYGGTASGVMAAVAAKKEGMDVILIEPSRWLGGMTGGGISNLDWGRRETVGGSTYEILRGQPGNEVYRKTFRELINKHDIQVIYNHRLGKVNGSEKLIQSIHLDLAPVDPTGCPIPEPKRINALTVEADVFIDCSYEGDLMASSGISYSWGRESSKKYGESLAGVRPSLQVYEIDPYLIPGDSKSGLIPFIQNRKIGPLGSADRLTMGYCFRFKFDVSGKGIPIPEPTAYDPAEFELFRRAYQNGVDISTNRSMKKLGIVEPRGNYFIGGDSGNLSRSLLTTTIYGCNDLYPNGDWKVRSSIWKFHQEFFCKLLHFLKTDSNVPEKRRKRAEEISFRSGVFDDTHGWPNQLYVREARRMISDYVVTQKDLEGKTDPAHSIGLASYGVDDWPYATVAENGKVALQGGEFSILYLDEGKRNGIYKIPYSAIIPKSEECENLIVPVCLSASHIAMTSIRMEPVWMILGESAGVASAMAVRDNCPVQVVSYDQLRSRLLELEQILDLPIAQSSRIHRWESHREWDREKPGYEWVYPMIDENADGKLSDDEYEKFQRFKQKHQQWDKALKNS